MKKSILIFGLLAAGVAVLGSLALPAYAQGRNITIKGSDTMVILGQRWAEVCMSKNPGVVIQVTGGGSGVGIAALINGTTDIAEASRPMKPTEIADCEAKRGKKVVEIPVALDGVAVYVNETNPVQELTLEQVRRIYTGVIKNWSEVGGNNERILLYGRENSSGTYAFVKEHVLQNADFYPTTQTLPGTAAVVNAVARDRRGIGYGGIAYGKGIKHLRLKKDANSPALEPSVANVVSQTYPISRYLFWYMAGEPMGDMKKLVEWVMSKDGQSVVENVGYYPLPEEIIAKYVGGAAKQGKGKKAGGK